MIARKRPDAGEKYFTMLVCRQKGVTNSPPFDTTCQPLKIAMSGRYSHHNCRRSIYLQSKAGLQVNGNEANLPNPVHFTSLRLSFLPCLRFVEIGFISPVPWLSQEDTAHGRFVCLDLPPTFQLASKLSSRPAAESHSSLIPTQKAAWQTSRPSGTPHWSENIHLTAE